MNKQFVFERFYWLENQIKEGKFPNRQDLADKFMITIRQASRDIDFIKNDLQAPLEYSRERKGYYYSSEHFEIPKPRLSENELIGLIMADKMAESTKNNAMHKKIDSFARKIFLAKGFDLDQIKRKLSIKNISYEKIESQVYDTILQALHSNQKIRIEHSAQLNQDKTSRIVNPLQLILYMGNWYLYAYCEKRKGYRTFAISRIFSATLLEEAVDALHLDKDVKQLIEESFGIYLFDRDAEKHNVQIKFKKKIADRLKNQIWVQSQKMECLSDGSILVSFDVIDFTEIISEVLRYGSDVEVIKPKALRKEIRRIVNEMVLNYSS